MPAHSKPRALGHMLSFDEHASNLLSPSSYHSCMAVAPCRWCWRQHMFAEQRDDAQPDPPTTAGDTLKPWCCCCCLALMQPQVLQLGDVAAQVSGCCYEQENKYKASCACTAASRTGTAAVHKGSWARRRTPVPARSLYSQSPSRRVGKHDKSGMHHRQVESD